MPIAVRPPRWLGTGLRVAAPRLAVVATLAATAALGVFAHEVLRDPGTRIGDRVVMRSIVRARRPVIGWRCPPNPPAQLRYIAP